MNATAAELRMDEIREGQNMSGGVPYLKTNKNEDNAIIVMALSQYAVDLQKNGETGMPLAETLRILHEYAHDMGV